MEAPDIKREGFQTKDKAALGGGGSLQDVPQEHLRSGLDASTGVQGDDQAGLVDQYNKPVEGWGASGGAGTNIEQENIRGSTFSEGYVEKT